MPRQLRQRTKRPNYAILSGYKSDEVAEDDGDASSDDFVPTVEPEQDLDEEDFDAVEEDENIEISAMSSKPAAKVIAQKFSKNKASTSTPSLSVAISRPSKPKNPANPAVPPPDHRYRAPPPYRTSARVERPAGPPSPCRPVDVVSTPNWASEAIITDRLNKAHMYNVGPGPVWELMEDRSWWKESITGSSDEGSESCRRPRVYGDVEVDSDLNVLDRKYASTWCMLLCYSEMQ
jgi:transcription factor C subunit 6